MLEYSVKVLPGEMSAVVINLLHDLVASHLVEITPACPKGQINDEQTKKLIELTDFIFFIPDEEI